MASAMKEGSVTCKSSKFGRRLLVRYIDKEGIATERGAIGGSPCICLLQ